MRVKLRSARDLAWRRSRREGATGARAVVTKTAEITTQFDRKESRPSVGALGNGATAEPCCHMRTVAHENLLADRTRTH
jgi:hypothetical protein